jgi:dienelactone hydrolase
VWDALRVPGAPAPYDTVHYRVAFPAARPDPARDPVLGLVPPSRRGLAVVVLHANFNMDGVGLRWLERSLALAGHAVVTPQWVGPMFDGRPGLATGVDLATLRHSYLDALRDSLRRSLVADFLDVNRVVLGGHSAGGTLALLSAGDAHGAFSYGGHTRTQAAQGHGADHYLPLPAGVPLLLMGGTEDGVVRAIAERDGSDAAAHPMVEAFERSVPETSQSWLVMVEGADHYAFVAGHDGATGRSYLEASGNRPASAVRTAVQPVIRDFVAWSVDADAAARQRLDQLVAAPPAWVGVARARPTRRQPTGD